MNGGVLYSNEKHHRLCCWWTNPVLLLVVVVTFLSLWNAFLFHGCSTVPQEPPANVPNRTTTTAVAVNNDAKTAASTDACQEQYDRVTADRTVGLSMESLERSRAWIGNKERMVKFATKLSQGDKPVHVVVCGGSISVGHGVHDGERNRYSGQLQQWLDTHYGAQQRQHKVHFLGAHGADMCNLSKRIPILLQDLRTQHGVETPDLFILEFAVNDYQGQDHVENVDFRFDVFFNGFQEIAECAEVVVRKLLSMGTAVMFLEFRTAIPSRRTAQLLHMGVAQHYEIPVISYAEAMYPEYLRLLSMLNQSESFSAPVPSEATSMTTATVLPYPYGCAPCREEDIQKQFRGESCRSLCFFLNNNNVARCDDTKELPEGRQRCFSPIFAHDCVHPTRVGHQIAKDLLVHAISSTERDYVCRQQAYQTHLLPSTGWLLESPEAIAARANFVLVQDTMPMYSRWDKLNPSKKSAGWSYYDDTQFNKPGWIATSANETIEFAIDLPPDCYSIYLAVLRSYEKMGTFTIKVLDWKTNKVTTMEADGLWKAHISVWSDIQVTSDEDEGCTGKCTVTVITHPEVPGRGGNKVKILTLSARKCQK